MQIIIMCKSASQIKEVASTFQEQGMTTVTSGKTVKVFPDRLDQRDQLVRAMDSLGTEYQDGLEFQVEGSDQWTPWAAVVNHMQEVWGVAVNNQAEVDVATQEQDQRLAEEVARNAEAEDADPEEGNSEDDD